MLSILHHKLNTWRCEALKMGRDNLDPLYLIMIHLKQRLIAANEHMWYPYITPSLVLHMLMNSNRLLRFKSTKDYIEPITLYYLKMDNVSNT